MYVSAAQYASSKVMLTVRESVALIFAIGPKSAAGFVRMSGLEKARSVKTTSSAVNGAPSCHVTLSRSIKTNVFASSEMSQRSASPGVRSPVWGLTRKSESYSARETNSGRVVISREGAPYPARVMEPEGARGVVGDVETFDVADGAGVLFCEAVGCTEGV